MRELSLWYSWQIAGVDLYHILAWFFLYSFLGWIWESSYVSVRQRKWINRGFVTGPCLTIYGAGAISVFLILKGLPRNIFLLYIGGVITATILEYVTAVVMESLFHMSWWDYSEKRYNFQGRICLSSSLFWGVMTVLLFYVLQPFVEKICNLVTVKTGMIILTGVIAIYIVDFTLAFIAASNLADKLHGINNVLDEWSDFIKESKLAESADEFKTKIKSAKHYFSDKTAKLQLEMREKEFLAVWDRTHGENDSQRKEEFQKKFQEYASKLMQLRKTNDHITKRFIYSYPRLGNLTRKNNDKIKHNK